MIEKESYKEYELYYSKKNKQCESLLKKICKKEFKLTARQSHRKEPCCSRKCGGIKSHNR